MRLAKARADLIRLKIELAAADIEAIEEEMQLEAHLAEADSDVDTVTTEMTTARRVNQWLDESQPGLAIDEHPHEVDAPQPTEEATQAPTGPPRPPRGPPAIIERRTTAIEKHTATPAGENNAAHTKIDLTELASAIALAAKAGQQQIAPRNFTELPPYSGAYQEWLSFRAAYFESASAHTNTENIARLRRSLRGRAKEAVENLLIYSTSAEEVMNTLQSRFGRPDAIALAELERLRALPRPSDAPKDLCIFATRVNNIVATLRALEKIYYLYNPEVTKATIEKLTPTLKYRWFDFAAEEKIEEPDLLKLARFLQREADRCGPYAQPEQIGESTGHPPHPRRAAQKTYATAIEEQECPVCNNRGHVAANCRKITEADIAARWDLAKSRSLCFRCLQHRTRSHRCKGKPCNIDGCEKMHHRLLHFKKRIAIENRSEEKPEIVTSTWAPTKTQAFLKIVPVCVSGPKGEVETHALLDDGSTVTLIDAEIARKTGVRGPVDPLHLEAIANTEVDASRSRRVTLTLRGTTQNHRIQARTFDQLRLTPQRVTERDIAGCTHIADIAGQLTYSNATPKLLIGQDNWHLLLAQEVRRGKKSQPVASLTPLGWVLHGAHTRTLGQRVQRVNHIVSADVDMDEQLRHHFALESLTITPRQPRSDPEQRALTMLRENTTHREDGRYETGLLWKKEDIAMPNNYDNAYNRLLSTEKKIDKNPELKRKYEEQMDALIEKGYAERAPPQTTQDRTWYLPHFPVINPMKPGKVRIVHDAAAKTRGVSLNDHLLTGPDLLQSLPGVLMRFRQHPVAITADIAEMFMQVKIKPEDRDALRYLWRGSERGDTEPQQYRMTSLIFGATSSPATAIFVKNANAAKYEHTHPAAYDAILRNHYVDDYLQSFKTEEEAIRTARDVREIHREAHYELRQWTSNSDDVLRALGEASAPTQPSIDLKDGAQAERVLGLIWRPTTDEIAFNLDLARLPEETINSTEPTKRQILKVIMSLFDPLGFAAPVTTRAKQILQETWRRGTGWDSKLDSDLARQWEEWMGHLRNLKKIALPRCYPDYSDAQRRELHVFVDASESAYAAALYWRVITADGETTVSLALAKARVAPLKVTSIPRLELQAAVMGSRMAAAIVEEHDAKPDEKIFWTDSKTVLTWLKTGARSYRPYVAHRIAAIEENSSINEWRWVPTKLNVADDATRDVPQDFDTSHRWFQGPAFLRGHPSTWPAETPKRVENTGEEKSCNTLHSKTAPASLKNSLPDSARFSRWERLLRATARVLQFIDLCRRKIDTVHYKRNRKNAEKDPTWRRIPAKKIEKTKIVSLDQKNLDLKYLPIEAGTLKRAETLLVRASQQESFGKEIEDLLRGKPVATDSRLRPLATEIVNGVITLITRIDAAHNIDSSVKRPPVLDGDSHIARLYMEHVHRSLHHAGVEATINECRQHYWILRLRPTARMIVHRCLPCRIKRTAPPAPPTGNHPHCRLAHHRRPFTFTGLDYFGPLTVAVGRAVQKRYVALFTCLTTRAVHLEVAASLSTDSAVMALRRMIARRGCPAEIWSDNGTNLQGAAKELRAAIDRATEEEASKRMISWRFIPPGAPFMGGAWERLVRSVKTALSAVLHERHPPEEVLTTLLTEAEYTVNSRPLTHVSVHPEDPEAITPNHFILGGSARTPPSGAYEDADLIGRTHWRASQRLADLFWARWLKEYLPELQYRREPHGKGPAIKIGDVVLIIDGTLPRNVWPRGLVTAVFPGPDGIIRAVDVRTKGGVLRRPTKKLVILPTEPAVLHQHQDASTGGRRAAGEMCTTEAQ